MSGTEVNAEFYEQLRLQRLQDGEGGEAQAARGRSNTFVDEDGTEFEWDGEKKAWFPKITEDFLASYHANYGYVEESPGIEDTGTQAQKEAAILKKSSQNKAPQLDPKKGEKRKADAGWIDVEEQKNTSVYVSGLPPDITNDEFVELMSKFGIIMQNPETEEYKIKLYKDKDGNLKGDGLCCFLKKESIDLALRFLDETEMRGYKLHVEAAKFEMKGRYDASKKKKKSKDYKKKLLLQKKQLDWRPERKAGSSRLRFERVVILKNLFHPKDFEEEPLALNEIRDDVRLECEKFGQVKKVLLFDRHPNGVASVAFKEPEQADMCVSMLNGRWFGGRQITAETWDGVFDYQIEETVKEREDRLKSWESFLEANPSSIKSADQQTITQAIGQVSVEIPAPPENSTKLLEDNRKSSVENVTPLKDNGKPSVDSPTPSENNSKASVDNEAPSRNSKGQDVIDAVSEVEEAEEAWNEENLSTDSSIDGSDDDAEEDP
ncbi:17S U2 SnRNP complex component HTATSF1 [Scyliorhinus torazame]|uniref:17S U2 SnRNP complex component HTATSF1 n=1 Tax=Scyliorhinus torazame TaxID=75743 RepID=UPI003B5C3D9D